MNLYGAIKTNLKESEDYGSLPLRESALDTKYYVVSYPESNDFCATYKNFTKYKDAYNYLITHVDAEKIFECYNSKSGEYIEKLDKVRDLEDKGKIPISSEREDYLQKVEESELDESELDESIKTNLKESDFDVKERKIPIDLNDDKSKEIISAVRGQIGDGIWENSPGMEKYCLFMGELDDNGNITVYTGYKPGWAVGRNSGVCYSAFNDMSDDAVKKFYANKIKQIVKREGLDWNRNNTEHCDYLDYHSGVTVRDAYKVYDRLLGRIDRITDSEKLKESDFDDIVKDSYNHFTSELGKIPTLEDIVDDIMVNYDQEYIKDETPEDSKNAIDDVRYVLRKFDLTYTDEGEPRKGIYESEEQAKEVLNKFNNSEKTNKEFMKALNDISKLEWDNDITKDVYDKYIKAIQDSYKNRNKNIKEAEDLVDITNMKPIGTYTLSNTDGLLIYDIDNNNNTVLVGDSINPDKAEWYNIKYDATDNYPEDYDFSTDEEFKDYVDAQLQGGRALDDPDYVNSLSPEEYENLLVNTWMKDPEIIENFRDMKKEYEPYFNYGEIKVPFNEIMRTNLHESENALFCIQDTSHPDFTNKGYQTTQFNDLITFTNKEDAQKYINYLNTLDKNEYKIVDATTFDKDKMTIFNTFDEYKKSLNESDTEDYWDATELDRKGFCALLKFNNPEKHANPSMKYIITNDNNEVYRFAMEGSTEQIKDTGAKIEFRKYLEDKDDEMHTDNFDNFEIPSYHIKGIFNKDTGEVIYTVGSNSTNRNEYRKNIKDLKQEEFPSTHEGIVRKYIENTILKEAEGPYNQAFKVGSKLDLLLSELNTALLEGLKAIGYDEEFKKDYTSIEANKNENNIEIYFIAELDYEEGENIVYYHLDDVLEKYDKDAYFEASTSGRWIATLNKNLLNESQSQEIEEIIADMKLNIPNIEEYLNAYYKKINTEEPKPAVNKDTGTFNPDWEDWYKNTSNILYNEDAWNKFATWVKENYNEDINLNEAEERLFNSVVLFVDSMGYDLYWNLKKAMSEKEIQQYISSLLEKGNEGYELNEIAEEVDEKDLIEPTLYAGNISLNEAENDTIPEKEYKNMTDEDLDNYVKFLKEELIYHTTKKQKEIEKDIEKIEQILKDRDFYIDSSNPDNYNIEIVKGWKDMTQEELDNYIKNNK